MVPRLRIGFRSDDVASAVFPRGPSYHRKTSLPIKSNASQAADAAAARSRNTLSELTTTAGSGGVGPLIEDDGVHGKGDDQSKGGVRGRGTGSTSGARHAGRCGCGGASSASRDRGLKRRRPCLPMLIYTCRGVRSIRFSSGN